MTFIRKPALVLVLSLSPVAVASGQLPDLPALPTTGIDFSGVDEFWQIVDILSSDVEPSAAQWDALLVTPGYRLAQIAIGDVIREDLRLAFKPSLRARFDSLSGRANDRAARLTHLVRARSSRATLGACHDSLERSELVHEALKTAARFLPPGATNVGTAPLIAFAIFRDDGYSLGGGVVVDLLRACEADFVLFLAHEFHHTYLGRAARVPVPSDSADRLLRIALEQLRNEGMADLIDKPYPLSSTNPVRARYVARYNEEYARTPAVVRELDSLLAAAAGDTILMEPIGRRVRVLLWNSGHAHGAYMAREIVTTFGVDSLFPGVLNPAAFLRTFAAAEQARGDPNPWSHEAMSMIKSLEQKYWR